MTRNKKQGSVDSFVEWVVNQFLLDESYFFGFCVLHPKWNVLKAFWSNASCPNVCWDLFFVCAYEFSLKSFVFTDALCMEIIIQNWTLAVHWNGNERGR